MNLLEVKNISKTYGSGETAVRALKEVSFSVSKGEFVSLAAVVAIYVPTKRMRSMSIIKAINEL